MARFRALLSIPSADDLSPRVLLAFACLEGESKVVGAMSAARKAKSLVQRWLAKAVDIVLPRGDVTDALTVNEVIIERDTIVVENVKVGRGARAANVACNYRVVEIYDKCYNKWFMSKQPYKVWKKESKIYKLKVRMLKKNALDEYGDVGLCGDASYGNDDICMIVEDSKVVSVVGKMQACAV